jgi:hypothetical protein
VRDLFLHVASVDELAMLFVSRTEQSMLDLNRAVDLHFRKGGVHRTPGLAQSGEQY